MHLIYLDESGNSGNNLNDSQQPIFVLCAMIVDELKWQDPEKDLKAVVEDFFPHDAPDSFEVHGADLRTGRGPFRRMSVTDRIRFRDAWMDVASRHGVGLIHRAIEKKRYHRWLHDTFGSGVVVNPHVAAFALLARAVDDHLKFLPGSPLGILVSDENKEIVADVEKSIRVLRGASGTLRLTQIIEKGFFIDSSKSLPLPLCDLFALSLRKMEEMKAGLPSRSIDESGVRHVQGMIHHGNEAFWDVIAWLTEQQGERKKEATRD